VTRALLEELVSIDSVNPTLVPGGAGEAEIGRFVAGWLDRHGVEVEYHELAPLRANVIGRVRGSGGGRSLMLNAHLDTVALGGPDGALRPRVDGSRLYGRLSSSDPAARGRTPRASGSTSKMFNAQPRSCSAR
jgi:acetylornithine deacetylase